MGHPNWLLCFEINAIHGRLNLCVDSRVSYQNSLHNSLNLLELYSMKNVRLNHVPFPILDHFNL